MALSVHAFAQRNTNTGSDAGNSGADNTSIGYKSGDLITGAFNTFLGSYSGRIMASSSFSNTFLGAYSGYNAISGSNNFFGGSYSGYNNTTGRANVFLGSDAGKDNTTGNYNTAVGSYSEVGTTGTLNTFVGYFSGRSGNRNVMIGGHSGGEAATGDNNTYLGSYTGYYAPGSSNVFIGYYSGYNEIGSNKLYIENSNSALPLIYGDFATDKVGINSLPNTTHTLTVGGTIHSTGLFVNGVPVSGDMSLWNRTGNNVFTVSTTDNIGIGTTLANNPNSYKLAVNGKIGAKEVQIENTSATWADYVFKPDYKLMSIEEVELFINKNQHLPEIPSAKDIEEHGHKLGEMDVLLLKKIEELTLYIIHLKKEIEELKKRK